MMTEFSFLSELFL